MPLPSTENDLKRRARRRLIGAVALTLLAVIVLPLLLEDEPPPASGLAVRMAVAPAPLPVPVPHPVAQPIQPAEPEVAVVPEPPPPVVSPAPAPKPDPKPEPVKSKTGKSEPGKPAPHPPAAKPAAPPVGTHKPVAPREDFVVQLAALSDTDKAQELKARAVKAGLPAFTDKVGHLTRVRVGPYPSRAAAVAAAVKLAEHNMAGQVLAQ